MYCLLPPPSRSLNTIIQQAVDHQWVTVSQTPLPALIVASFLDKIGFVEYIDAMVTWDPTQWQVSPGNLAKTLVLAPFIHSGPCLPIYSIAEYYQGLDMALLFTPEIAKSLHTFDRHLSGTIRIHNKTIRLEQSYIINSLMEEAIASSILEGAATTRKKAKEMLMAGRKPKTNGEQMVINNYEAMRFILEKKDEPISPQLICDIHRIVTRATIEEEDVGWFRTNNDIVVADPATGIVLHTPPNYQELQKLISEFCRFANEDGSGTGSPTEVFIEL